jgi:hypothetical protein
VVVLDNLGAHGGDRVRELSEHAAASFCSTAYYKLFSPIEEAFTELKALL